MTISKVPAGTLTPADPTPGVLREAAVVTGDLWSGRAVTEAGVASGWHHHGDHDTVIYVVSGSIAVETSDGVVQGDPGDFLHVPPHTVHRESNPSEVTAEVVLLRRGTGPVTVNVDAPDGGRQ
jgi:uncharacterized RmlC-like cupin family protein